MKSGSKWQTYWLSCHKNKRIPFLWCQFQGRPCNCYLHTSLERVFWIHLPLGNHRTGQIKFSAIAVRMLALPLEEMAGVLTKPPERSACGLTAMKQSILTNGLQTKKHCSLCGSKNTTINIDKEICPWLEAKKKKTKKQTWYSYGPPLWLTLPGRKSQISTSIWLCFLELPNYCCAKN